MTRRKRDTAEKIDGTDTSLVDPESAECADHDIAGERGHRRVRARVRRAADESVGTHGGGTEPGVVNLGEVRAKSERQPSDGAHRARLPGSRIASGGDVAELHAHVMAQLLGLPAGVDYESLAHREERITGRRHDQRDGTHCCSGVHGVSSPR